MRPAAVAALFLLAGCTPPVRVERVPTASPQQVERAVARVADRVRGCYRLPRVPRAGRLIVTRLQVAYAPDGSLIGLPHVAAQEGVTAANRAWAARMAEAALAAAVRCVPVTLPPEMFRNGRAELELTFSIGVSA